MEIFEWRITFVVISVKSVYNFEIFLIQSWFAASCFLKWLKNLVMENLLFAITSSSGVRNFSKLIFEEIAYRYQIECFLNDGGVLWDN